jgi:DNA-binding XRE family transcriptional regulator
MKNEPDFLDEIIADSTAQDPGFPAALERAVRNREVLRALAAERKRRKISQTVVAAAMGTSQSAVSDLETSSSDALMSTVEKYAHALGLAVEYRLVPLSETRPAILVDDRHTSSVLPGRRPHE